MFGLVEDAFAVAIRSFVQDDCSGAHALRVALCAALPGDFFCTALDQNEMLKAEAMNPELKGSAEFFQKLSLARTYTLLCHFRSTS